MFLGHFSNSVMAAFASINMSSFIATIGHLLSWLYFTVEENETKDIRNILDTSISSKTTALFVN